MVDRPESWGRSHQRVRPMRLMLLVIALLTASFAGAQTKSGGGYTSAQASHGATVYTQSCVSCHGANLQGESAPALTGQIFRQAYGSGTAAQLYDFISRQMPQDKPASLSQQQYLDVTAYILSRNGFAAGNAPLQMGSLGQVSLAGISGTATQASTTDEIVRAAPPVRNVYSKLPQGANVNVTDSMMRGAVSDENNWLLHGRTYDNQRYSPLKQITADNAKSGERVWRRAQRGRLSRCGSSPTACPLQLPALQCRRPAGSPL